MIDFAAARRMMVDSQIRPNDVTDFRLIEAMREIPREHFISSLKAGMAYFDIDLPVGQTTREHPARCLLKPMVLAKLLQAADISENDRVLDIGCTTGYSSAIISRLANSVVALEEDADLAGTASRLLANIGARNVNVVTGPLSAGWIAGAPYDVILLNGASDIEPRQLFDQLKEGGRFVGIVGRAPLGKAMLYRVAHGHISGRAIFDASAPLLPGFAVPTAFVF